MARHFRSANNNHTPPPPLNIPNHASTTTFDKQAEALIPAEVLMISGCHSEQTSADLGNIKQVANLPDPAGKAGGACTSALLEILYRHQQQSHDLSFQQILLQLRQSLANKYLDQIPQLSSSRPLELKHTPFEIKSDRGVSRALLVGINYRGQYGELSGCHNDIYNVRKYLIRVQGYQPNDIVMLLDNGNSVVPTRQKIILGLQQLVAQSVAGDHVYVHYSGHGGLLAPSNPFKCQTYEETLYPLDHRVAGQIRDFSLFHHFVQPLSAGVKATCVFDCCHSGTVLDLPYSFQPTPAGTIESRSSMDHLSNLAFLSVLAGNVLPYGFGNIVQHIENTIGGNLDDYQGTGVEELAITDMTDDTDFQEAYDFAPNENYGDDTARDVGDNYGPDGDNAVGADAYGNGFGGGERYGEGGYEGGLDQEANVVQGQPVDPNLYGDAGDQGFEGVGGDWGDVQDAGIDDADCGCGDILGGLMDAAGDMDF